MPGVRERAANFNQIKSRPFKFGRALIYAVARRTMAKVCPPKSRKHKNATHWRGRMVGRSDGRVVRNSFPRGHATPSDFRSVFRARSYTPMRYRSAPIRVFILIRVSTIIVLTMYAPPHTPSTWSTPDGRFRRVINDVPRARAGASGRPSFNGSHGVRPAVAVPLFRFCVEETRDRYQRPA